MNKSIIRFAAGVVAEGMGSLLPKLWNRRLHHFECLRDGVFRIPIRRKKTFRLNPEAKNKLTRLAVEGKNGAVGNTFCVRLLVALLIKTCERCLVVTFQANRVGILVVIRDLADVGDYSTTEGIE